jgi:MOSC domain-containing protein YiiM
MTDGERTPATGRLEAIWIKRAHRGRMAAVEQATLVPGRGIEGNADQGGWRQVTVISRETWDRLMDSLQADIDPVSRRANLLVSGVSLRDVRRRTLQIGDCAIQLMGETRPCERMEEALPGLREAMRADWGGGAFGYILEGGDIRVGDEVRLL